MESIINFGIPHIGEHIFANLETDDLLQCLEVSQAWKVLAETVLLLKWKDKLFEACETGKTEIVKLLLENYNSEEIGLNVKDECDVHGRTPFIVACQNGHEDVVKIFLEYSNGTIDFNARDNWGITAFMLACDYGNKDVVKLLLEHSGGNIDFNARDDDGWTAFMYACHYGQKDVVKLILKFARAKDIKIPKSSIISKILRDNTYYEIKRSKEIRALIENFNEEKRLVEIRPWKI